MANVLVPCRSVVFPTGSGIVTFDRQGDGVGGLKANYVEKRNMVSNCVIVEHPQIPGGIVRRRRGGAVLRARGCPEGNNPKSPTTTRNGFTEMRESHGSRPTIKAPRFEEKLHVSPFVFSET